MKFIFNVSPNLRQKQSTKRIMFELLLGLLVVYAFSLFYYYSEHGTEVALQAIILMATSLGVTFAIEILWALFTRQKVFKFLSGSFGWITAIILTLMCPITITPYALGIATLFAILFGKLIFGGFGQNIFNPAALGRAIIFASFMGASTDVITGATITTKMANEYNWLVLDQGLIDKLLESAGGIQNLFVGFYPGAIGETSALIILLVGIVLALRKVIDWKLPVIFVGTVFVLASVIALTAGMSNWLWYPLFHIFSGGVMFGAVFMMTDPVTSPTSTSGKCIFALGAAIITVLIRIKANLPEGVLYSILIMNMMTPMIEKAMDGKQLVVRKKAIAIFSVIAALGIGSVALATTVVEPAKAQVKEVKTININDEYVASLQAEITATVDNGDGTTTYTVSAQGFAAKEGPNMPNYNHSIEPNIFDIKVDNTSKTIVNVVATSVKDTEYIGDKIKNPKFLKQFEGMDLKGDVNVEANDAVTGATYSVKSVVRAIAAVRTALGL